MVRNVQFTLIIALYYECFNGNSMQCYLIANISVFSLLFVIIQGETMLSPLVMCGPQALEFLVPVTLNIPHYASKTASLGLSLKATDSEKNLQTNWDNIELPSNTAAHTVSVKVDHF